MGRGLVVSLVSLACKGGATVARRFAHGSLTLWTTWIATNMNAYLKGLIREFVPPIVLRGATAAMARKHRPDNQAEQSGQKGAEWYDASFEACVDWLCHYSESEYYFLWAVIVDRIQRVGCQSLLEIGCGTGQLANLIRDKIACKYSGFDFSQRRIEHAQKAYPDLSFVQQDAFQTNLFTTSDYDTVVCTEFLEHVEGDTVILGKVRKGSRFYGTVPNFPFIAHVRHFQDENEVRSRYARYFNDLRVDRFLANPKGKAFFLLDGEIS